MHAASPEANSNELHLCATILAYNLVYARHLRHFSAKLSPCNLSSALAICNELAAVFHAIPYAPYAICSEV